MIRGYNDVAEDGDSWGERTEDLNPGIAGRQKKWQSRRRGRGTRMKHKKTKGNTRLEGSNWMRTGAWMRFSTAKTTGGHIKAGDRTGEAPRGKVPGISLWTAGGAS